ncbi:MAG: hypothetical protein AB8B63_15135 [Granulosicoccus sp.]
MHKSVRSTSKIACIWFGATVSLMGSQTFAADWCDGRVTDRDPRIVQPVSKPDALASYIDPAFGTTITRVTSAPEGDARRTLYSTIQPWNADESLLVLYHTGGSDAGHHLYDGRTYRHLGALPVSAADIEGIYWDPAYPDYLYFIQKRPKDDALYGNLVRYDVRENRRELVADLSGVCGHANERTGVLVTGGNDIQGLGGDLVGLRCQNNLINRQPADITFTVSIRTGEISKPVVLNPARAQGTNHFGYVPVLAAAPLPSGERVLVQSSVYDRDMNFLYTMDSSFARYRAADGREYSVPKPEHSTTGRMPDGNDALFTPQYDPAEYGCAADSDYGRGSLVAYDIDAQRCSVIIGRSTGWDYPLSGVHLSALSQQNPGWVSMSTMGYGHFEHLTNRQPAPVFFSELSLTYADPEEPVTCRLAHTRSYGKSARNSASYSSSYFGEPHPVMSPSGSRILFNSDWYDSGTVDTYAISLDNSQNTEIQITSIEPTPTEQPTMQADAVAQTPATQDEPADTAIGYVFSRTDTQEFRWIDSNSEGLTGSIWISPSCAASLGGPKALGDWRELMAVAPALDTVDNPCASLIDRQADGYVYSRTDKTELRWISVNAAGDTGSIWISPRCAAELGGPEAQGDWRDLMARAPAFDTVTSPCPSGF